MSLSYWSIDQLNTTLSIIFGIERILLTEIRAPLIKFDCNKICRLTNTSSQVCKYFLRLNPERQPLHLLIGDDLFAIVEFLGQRDAVLLQSCTVLARRK